MSLITVHNVALRNSEPHMDIFIDRLNFKRFLILQLAIRRKKKGDPWNQSCHQSLMGAEILSVFSQDFQWFVLIR